MKSRNIGRIPIKLVLVLLCVLAFTVFACKEIEDDNTSPNGEVAQEPEIGSSAPAGNVKHDIIRIKGTSHFNDEILDYDGAVLVDFTADWCKPCRMISPHIDKLAEEKASELKVVKVYSDEKGDPNRDLFKEYGIRGIPTLIIFKSGEIASKVTGYKDYSKLKSWVEDNL